MTTLLAVETSGTLCSLAVHVSGCWFEDTHNVERLHNRVVLQRLETLCATAGVGRHHFDAVAFGAGPASFTGVRIAAAVAQGVAFASDAIVVPVPSSRALAAVAVTDPRWPEGGERLVTVTRSRRDAYYLAGFTVPPEGEPVPHLADRLHQGTAAPDQWLSEARWDAADWVGAGDQPPWWPDRLRFLGGVSVTAVAVGALALQSLAHGAGVPAEAALPLYVNGDSPWRPKPS